MESKTPLWKWLIVPLIPVAIILTGIVCLFILPIEYLAERINGESE
jgi:hypothetical protein